MDTVAHRLFTLFGIAKHTVEELSYRGRPKGAFDYKYKGGIGVSLLGWRSSFGAELSLTVCFFWRSTLTGVEGRSHKALSHTQIAA